MREREIIEGYLGWWSLCGEAGLVWLASRLVKEREQLDREGFALQARPGNLGTLIERPQCSRRGWAGSFGYQQHSTTWTIGDASANIVFGLGGPRGRRQEVLIPLDKVGRYIGYALSPGLTH